MKSLALKVQRFLVSEDGPTAVEYAVMLALIVIVCLTAITAVGSKASSTFRQQGHRTDPSGQLIWLDVKPRPARADRDVIIVKTVRTPSAP